MKIKRPVNLYMTSFDHKIYIFYKYIGVLCFIINLTIFIVLQCLVENYSAFKNGGESFDYIQYLPIPHNLSLYVSWFSRTYLFMLPFHFYFLKNRNLKEAIFALILSGNYILVGLAGFSRSSTVSFILIYGILFIYFWKSIEKDILKKASKYLIAGILSFSILFYGITMNRFSGESEFVTDAFLHKDGLINDPVLNSQVSYLSQWYNKTTYWIPQYSKIDLTNGVRSMPLLFFILQKMGISNSADKLPDEMIKQFNGSDAGSFMGINTNLIFDVGYFITFLLILIYAFIVNKSLKTKKSSIIDFFLVVILIEIPATGIFNSCLNGMGWHLSLCLFLIYKFFSKKNSNI